MRQEKGPSPWPSKSYDIPAEKPQAAGVAIDKSERIYRLVDHVARRRRKGEFVPDRTIIQQHPELMPELATELKLLEDARRAYLAAQKAGPIHEPLKILSMEELEQPLEESETSDVDEPVRVRINGYTIIDEINHGGQATVYKAIQDATGKKVAIKVVYGVHSRARQRVDREADILVALDHPNIVGILDRGRTADGSFFIVMDFVEGYSLDEFLEPSCAAGPGTLDDLVHLFIKAFKAVGYAHEQGVLHRDLKPSNLRIDLRGEPHVLDFGLARLTQGTQLQAFSQHSITHSGQLIGSLPWCSPEQATGKQDEISIRSDVYALGLMLYQALAGEAPYLNRGRIDDVIGHILKSVPKPLSGRAFARWGAVPPKLEAIVLRCLEKSPEQRFASASELAGALEEWQKNPDAPARVQLPKARRPRVLVASVTSLVMIGLLWIPAGLKWFPWQQKGATLAPVEMVNGRPIYTSSFGMQFVYCPLGEYQMGLRPFDTDYHPANGIHPEKITKGFYIATKELTQSQYLWLMTDRAMNERFPGPDLPMGSVRWIDAKEFCRRLSDKTHQRYRLPKEVEWEYACRAGSPGNFGGSLNLDDVGWYSDNTPKGIMPKGGSKKPNAWKIYDMHGSVWEWCEEDYQSYDPAFRGPKYQAKEPSKVLRGGDIQSQWLACRAGYRARQNPNLPLPQLVGIRLVLEAEDAK